VSYFDSGQSVQETIDGGFIIAGSTSTYSAGPSDVYLIKTDAMGIQQWYRTFGGNGDDEGYSVHQTTDGGFIIVGDTWSYGVGYPDVYIIKTDSLGNQEWYQTFGGSEGDYGYSVQQTSDGGYIIVGRTSSFGAGNEDVYLIRLGAETGVSEQNNSQILNQFTLEPVFPNPFNNNANIIFNLDNDAPVKLKVFNPGGELVAILIEENLTKGFHHINWNAGDLSSGIYLITLESAGETRQMQKALLLK
jgi:hypothetical protein